MKNREIREEEMRGAPRKFELKQQEINWHRRSLVAYLII